MLQRLGAKRDRLKGNDPPKRKILVGKASTPMVMTLRGEEKSFDVAFQALEQIGEARVSRPIFQLSLVLQKIARTR